MYQMSMDSLSVSYLVGANMPSKNTNALNELRNTLLGILEPKSAWRPIEILGSAMYSLSKKSENYIIFPNVTTNYSFA